MFTNPSVRRYRNDDQTNRNAVFSDTHTFSPTLLNDLRIGVSRQLFTFVTVGADEGIAQQIGLPASIPGTQTPDINVRPYPRIGGGALGTRSSLNWDIQNMITKISGNHTFKFGVNARETVSTWPTAVTTAFKCSQKRVNSLPPGPDSETRSERSLWTMSYS